MSKLPNIVIPAADLERLEALIDAPPRGMGGASAELSRELARATFVDSNEVPANVVTMNSIVRFAMAATGEVHELRLCYPADANGGPGRISVLTPVGTALLGLSEGDEISWAGPGGNAISLRVIQVVFQPERARTLAAQLGSPGPVESPDYPSGRRPTALGLTNFHRWPPRD